MNPIHFSIEKPVTVIVGILLLVLFGLISLFKMPYQLSPSVMEPVISVQTIWPGATPYEIERDIIEEQEDVLKGIPGLVEMESSSFNGSGSITLQFEVGMAVEEALLRVSNRLDEVPSYPENVEKPVISATGASTSPIIWMILRKMPENPNNIRTYQTYFENEVRQYLERVEGVGDLLVVGGTAMEMHTIVDPHKLSAYKLTVAELIALLRAENVNISAGNMDVGRRDYRIRSVADFDSPEEIEQIVIWSTGQQRVTVGDVARVAFGYERTTNAMIHNGEEGISVGVKPEPDVNVLEVTDNVEKVVNWLNEHKLASEKIYLDWVYDERPYINGAINLVKRNILIGGMLAITVLLLFLRRFSSTLVVAAAIPISIIGTFIFMNGLGRNLNVVSLAGISFAVGMLVDSAIVVMENIDRHRNLGKAPFQAAYDGTREVWGAILASTLTSVAVFLPVIFIEEEAGQLFKDIAIAVTWALLLSLFVSTSVIPMFSRRLLSFTSERATPKRTLLTRLGAALSSTIMALVGVVLKTWTTRIATIVVMTALSLALAALLFPKMEYLPQGNRNLVINILVPPPGISYEERKSVGEELFRFTKPYFRAEHEGFPAIENMFYVGAESVMFFGASTTDQQRAGELVPLFTGLISSIPGMFGVSMQAGIFQTRLGRSRTIDVDVGGGDINQVVAAAKTIFGQTMAKIPGVQVRPVPSLEMLYPEVRIFPRRDRLRAVQMTAQELGVAVDVLMDGRKIGDFKQEGEKKIDLVVKASREDIFTPEILADAPIVTPEGKLVPLFSLATIVNTVGINEIRHLERQRTVTLQVNPPLTLPLQRAMEIVTEDIIAPLRGQGLLQGIDIRLSGAADKLTETREALQWNFVLAGIIIYLLMSALFGNFIYPFIIMFTVPLAAAGGFVGLKLVNVFILPQPMDVLTMLGFVILIGVVVNNAILIVYQSLLNVRERNMEHLEAVKDATRIRLRPIYMSASTSIFGMLPLVVAPGPGSELYRGLGSVLLGGIAFSTIFTVFVIPCLLMFFIGMENKQGN